MLSLLSSGILFSFCKSPNLTARKYLKSLSQTALHYKPQKLRWLNQKQCLSDRIVQNFFDTSNIQISIGQSGDRLNEIKDYSTPAHSYYCLKLPFQKNQHLRRKMLQFYNNNIRTGRILELMDYIAANVAYRYCKPVKKNNKQQLNINNIQQLNININNKQHIININKQQHILNNNKQQQISQQYSFYAVTASIDQIQFYHPVIADIDCQFSGYVSYVGRSSMEIQIDVLQQINQQRRLNCSAKFVMVARDKNTGKSYNVPKLKIQGQTQLFKIIYELGQQRQKLRKQQAKKSLIISPPTYQQSSRVHQKLLSIKKQSQSSKYIPIDSTEQKTTLLMHLQDKNLHGKIFGGYVLKLAYQLAWVCVYKHLKGGIPIITQIDDVQFLAPVQIGTSLQYTAKITYIQNNLIHVVVNCKNTTGKGQERLTNILNLTFMHNQDENNIKQVYPETIQNMNQYIEGFRKVAKVLKY